MRFTSTKAFLHIIFSILFFLWILILTLVTVNHSLSCIDKNGCLREYCNRKKLYEEYRNIIDYSGCIRNKYKK